MVGGTARGCCSRRGSGAVWVGAGCIGARGAISRVGGGPDRSTAGGAAGAGAGRAPRSRSVPAGRSGRASPGERGGPGWRGRSESSSAGKGRCATWNGAAETAPACESVMAGMTVPISSHVLALIREVFLKIRFRFGFAWQHQRNTALTHAGLKTAKPELCSTSSPPCKARWYDGRTSRRENKHRQADPVVAHRRLVGTN